MPDSKKFCVCYRVILYTTFATYNNRESSKTREIFPPDPITKDYILIVRLRPKISDTIPGEEIKLEAKMELETAKENSAFNVSSTCSYAYTPDRISLPREWTEKKKELHKQGFSKEEIERVVDGAVEMFMARYGT